MASNMKNWIRPCIEEELKLAIASTADPPRSDVKLEDFDQLSVSTQFVPTHSQDGSNLRIKVPCDKTQTRSVQILKFHTFENPIRAEVSDAYTSIKVTFASQAVQDYNDSTKKKFTTGTVMDLIRIREFEIVATPFGPRDEQMTLFIQDFTHRGSISQGAFGHPQPVESNVEASQLLAQLAMKNSWHSKSLPRSNTELSTRLKRRGSPRLRDSSKKSNTNLDSTQLQMSFASQSSEQLSALPSNNSVKSLLDMNGSQSSSVKYQQGSKGPKIQRAVEDRSAGREARLLGFLTGKSSHITGTEPVRNLGTTTTPVLQLSELSGNDETTIRFPILGAPVTTDQSLEANSAAEDGMSTASTEKKVATKHILGTRDHLVSSLAGNEGAKEAPAVIQPTVKASSRGVRARAWHFVISDGGTIRVPSDQEEAMDRLDAILQPGTRVPQANLPTLVLAHFSELANKSAQAKECVGDGKGELKPRCPSVENVANSKMEKAAELSDNNVEMEPGASQTKKPASESSVDSSDGTSIDWPDSLQDHLPQDSPVTKDTTRSIDVSAVRHSLDSDSELETAVPQGLSENQQVAVNASGKRLPALESIQNEQAQSKPAIEVPQTPLMDFRPHSPDLGHTGLAATSVTHKVISSTNSTSNKAFAPSVLSYAKSLTSTDQSMPHSSSLSQSALVSSDVESNLPGREIVHKLEEQMRPDAKVTSEQPSRSASLDVSQGDVILEDFKMDESNDSNGPPSKKNVPIGNEIASLSPGSIKRKIIEHSLDSEGNSSKRLKLHHKFEFTQEPPLSQPPLDMARQERHKFMQRWKLQHSDDPVLDQKAQEPIIPTVHPSFKTSVTVTSSSELKNARAVFEAFADTYPNYEGDFKHFTGLCRMLAKLQQSSRAPHRSLWDDFIVRHKTNYSPYIIQCTTEGDDPVSYEEFYRDEIEEPLYQKRIMSPSSLLTVVGMEYQGPSALRADTSSTVPSSRRSSYIPSTRVSTASANEKSHSTSLRQSPVRPEPLNEPFTDHIAPPTGSHGDPIPLDGSDSEQSASIRSKRQVSASGATREMASTLNSSHSSSTRKSRILPWDKSLDPKSSPLMPAFSPTVRTPPSSRTKPSDRLVSIPRIVPVEPQRPSSSIRPHAGQSLISSLEMDGYESSDLEMEAEWWREDNTPFKAFAQAMGDLKSVGEFLPELGTKPADQSKTRKVDVLKWQL